MCKVCENNKKALTNIFIKNKMLVHEQFGGEQFKCEQFMNELFKIKLMF